MRCSSTTRGVWIIGKCKSISPTFRIFWYFAFSNIYSSILLTKFVLHTLGYAFDFLRYSEKLRKESNEIGYTLESFVMPYKCQSLIWRATSYRETRISTLFFPAKILSASLRMNGRWPVWSISILRVSLLSSLNGWTWFCSRSPFIL